MNDRLAFTRLVHSDWSTHPDKRWSAFAVRDGLSWHIERVVQTPVPQEFLNNLFDTNFHTLAGFDFAIGLPASYLAKIESEFTDLLLLLDREPWHEFDKVANSVDEISLYRPFYPNSSRRGSRRVDLIDRLGIGNFDELYRECERCTKVRRSASPIFWTIGGKQVGKATLSGLLQIVFPARARGAALWPFDGKLSALTHNTLTIAETYPAEAYSHVGIQLLGKSKKSQVARKEAMAGLMQRCEAYGITLNDKVQMDIRSGFSSKESDEDQFDALAGLASMIDVANGQRQESPESNVGAQLREGWILGQIDLPCSITRSRKN